MSEHQEAYSTTEDRRKRQAASSTAWANFSGSIVTMAITVGGGLAALLFLMMVFKNIWLMMWRFPLYFVALALVIAAIVFTVRKTGIWGWGGLLTLVVAGASGFLGFKGVAAVYGSGNRHYPSVYCADYVRKLPDGSTPKLHEKRNGRGKEVAALTPGQWVKVNGITFTKKEYNITTWDGATGWVPLEAFPKDGADWLFDRFASDGSLDRYTGKDRQVEQYSGKYLKSKRGGEMLPATMQRAIRINAKTPLMALSREEFKEKGDTAFVESGMTVTLEHIVYADECTMLHLSVNKGKDWHEYQSLGGTFESLVVKNLETGETRDVMPAGYNGWEDDSTRHVVFFFRAFNWRHFSLAHAGYPTLERRGGGVIGKIASVVSSGSGAGADYFTDWNFTEVNVR